MRVGVEWNGSRRGVPRRSAGSSDPRLLRDSCCAGVSPFPRARVPVREQKLSLCIDMMIVRLAREELVTVGKPPDNLRILTAEQPWPAFSVSD